MEGSWLKLTVQNDMKGKVYENKRFTKVYGPQKMTMNGCQKSTIDEKTSSEKSSKLRR